MHTTRARDVSLSASGVASGMRERPASLSRDGGRVVSDVDPADGFSDPDEPDGVSDEDNADVV